MRSHGTFRATMAIAVALWAGASLGAGAAAESPLLEALSRSGLRPENCYLAGRRISVPGIVARHYRLPTAAFPHEFPSTLSSSPHVQRFTLDGIVGLLSDSGFDVEETDGSVVFSGPFSNLFFTGAGPVMRLNIFLRRMFPSLSANFYISARRR